MKTQIIGQMKGSKIMAKIYYHTQAGATGKFVIWSHASSLTEAGKTLAKHNRIWPDSSSDGQVITIGKKQRGRTGIRPIKEYRLFGDKLVKIADFYSYVENSVWVESHVTMRRT